jgi:Ca2+-binding EF-hand superfamily protein
MRKLMVKVEFGAHRLSRPQVRAIRALAVNEMSQEKDRLALCDQLQLKQYANADQTIGGILHILKEMQANHDKARADEQRDEERTTAQLQALEGKAREAVAKCAQAMAQQRALLEFNMKRLLLPLTKDDVKAVQSAALSQFDTHTRLDALLRRVTPSRSIRAPQLAKIIMELYFEKIYSDRLEAQVSFAKRPFFDFLYDHMLKKYGLPSIAEKHIANLCANVVAVLQLRGAPKRLRPRARAAEAASEHPHVILVLQQFVDLVHLYSEQPVSTSGVSLFLRALDQLQSQVQTSLPILDQKTHLAQTANSKAKLASLRDVYTHQLMIRSNQSAKPAASVQDDAMLVPLGHALDSASLAFAKQRLSQQSLDNAIHCLERDSVQQRNTKRVELDGPTTSKPLLQQHIIRLLTMRCSHGSLEALFLRFDTDNNGLVSHQEFKQGIAELKLGLDTDAVDEMIALLDYDGDGSIDYREFSSAYVKITSWISVPQYLDAVLRGYRDELRAAAQHFVAMFQSADKNADGVLTFSEFLAMVHDVDSSKSDAEIIRMFREALEEETKLRGGAVAFNANTHQLISSGNDGAMTLAGDSMSSVAFATIAKRYGLGDKKKARADGWLRGHLRRSRELKHDTAAKAASAASSPASLSTSESKQ